MRWYGLLPSFLLCMASAFGQEIVAHRGASADAPENTLAAFKLAWEQGADAIEGDFYLSADHEIVCIHDKDTERTAPGQAVRKVSESTLDQLKQLDVGKWKGERFQGERIPTIEEVFAVIPKGKKILIEIKCGPEIKSRLLKEFGEGITSIEFGSANPEKVAILTGSGRSALDEMKSMGTDTLITGELPGAFQSRPGGRVQPLRLRTLRHRALRGHRTGQPRCQQVRHPVLLYQNRVPPLIWS